MRKKIEAWLQSLRVYSLTMSLFPPVIVCLIARNAGTVCDRTRFTCFLPAVLLLHTGTNVLNDYYDHHSGVDDDDAPGPSGVIQQKKCSPQFMLRSGTLYFAVALLISLPIILSRPIVLLPGGVAAVTAYFYTNRAFSLKYCRLGEVAVFLLFGPLMFICATLSFTSVHWLQVLPVSLPFGCYAAAVLFINNTRDRIRDSRAGIRTLPMLFTVPVARTVFGLLVLTALLLLNLFPWPDGTAGQLPLLSGCLLTALIILSLSARRSIDRLPVVTAFFLLPLSLLYIARLVW